MFSQLKPYVSYKAKEIIQGELTPHDIFNTVYAPSIEDDYKSGKLEVTDGQVKLKDGRIVSTAQFSAKKSTE